MIHVAILTISDSVVGGTREDTSGPALTGRVEELGWYPTIKLTLPDVTHGISAALSELAAEGKIDVAILTGGTGVALRDVTPEAVRAIADREIPGFGELMRHEGRKSTKLAPLSRCGGFTRGRMLILALPGSPRGAVDSLDAVADLVPHVVDLLQGRTDHVEKPSS
jgi:molybdenum cofactor synthesis domain-containing protein